jgi:hypothetical protein
MMKMLEETLFITRKLSFISEDDEFAEGGSFGEGSDYYPGLVNRGIGSDAKVSKGS